MSGGVIEYAVGYERRQTAERIDLAACCPTCTTWGQTREAFFVHVVHVPVHSFTPTVVQGHEHPKKTPESVAHTISQYNTIQHDTTLLNPRM